MNFETTIMLLLIALITGHKVTLKQSIEDSKMRSYLRPRRSNDYELIFNKTAQVYKTAPKFDSCVCE